MKSLFIRADSTNQIGTGHIMRCIALGQAWQDEGGKVVFLSHCESDALRERIVKEGFKFVPIDHPHPHPSDLSQTLMQLQSFLPSLSSFSPSVPWLVLDGYHFTPDYQDAIKDAGILLLVIDDMNHLPYYHADIILNQNIHATDMEYNCDPNTKLLLGPKYVLLRREFLKYKEFNREIPDKARKILVTMGGADPDNVTLKVIQALNLLNDSELEVKVVIGPSNPHMESIKKELSLSPFSFHLLPSVDNMADLMAWADLAIAAGGSTSWELVFMKTPSVFTITSQDQYQIVKALVTKGIADELNGQASESDYNTIIYTIFDPKKRANMSSKGRCYVDGKGAKRVIQEAQNV